MNERIRELAEQQAGSILMDLVMPDAGMPERIKWNIGCTTAHLEKFAELIVRECVGLIRKQSIGEEILGGQRYKTVQLGETIATITEHFGVEE